MNNMIDSNGNKYEFEDSAEDCDQCNSKMDMWHTQYIEDGYDHVVWICKNDESCNNRVSRYHYHNDPAAKPYLLS